MPCLRCRRASESLRQHLCQSCSRQRKCPRDASRSDADARCSAEGWHDLKIGRSCKSEAKQRNCMELWTMMKGFLQGVRDLKVAKTRKTFLFLSFPLKFCRKSHQMSGKAYKAKWEHLKCVFWEFWGDVRAWTSMDVEIVHASQERNLRTKCCTSTQRWRYQRSSASISIIFLHATFSTQLNK